MQRGRLKEPILITGVSGFLGSRLAERCADNGENVIGVVRDFERTSAHCLEGLRAKITVCQGDVTDTDRMREIIAGYEVGYIFHCAAHSIVRKCANDPFGCFQTNVLGTASVLEAARNIGNSAGIMVMESDKSYGPALTLPYKEDDALKPRGIYEASKACAGFVALSYAHNFDMPIFTIRAANLYGPGDRNTSRLIPNSILRTLRGERPVLYGNVADYVREFLFVEDAVTAMLSLMGSIEETAGEAFNLGSGEKYAIKDVVVMIMRALGTDLEPEIIPKPEIFKEIPEQYLDTSKVRALLPNDFHPLTLAKGLALSAPWYTEEYRSGRM